MGRHNKSTQGISDAIKPITLVVSAALWDKFKILATSRALTLNDYLVSLITTEVSNKADALSMLQDKSVVEVDALKS